MNMGQAGPKKVKRAKTQLKSDLNLSEILGTDQVEQENTSMLIHDILPDDFAEAKKPVANCLEMIRHLMQLVPQLEKTKTKSLFNDGVDAEVLPDLLPNLKPMKIVPSKNKSLLDLQKSIAKLLESTKSKFQTSEHNQ